MNWFGWSVRGLLLAIAACFAGALAYRFLFVHNVEAPWIVGAIVGLVVAATSNDTSLMRGLMAGTLAVWTGAIIQVVSMGQPVVRGLVDFHASLTMGRFAMHLACALLAIVVGMRSFRSNQRRFAGT